MSSFKCASFSTVAVKCSGQHLFLFLLKKIFLFQNYYLDSLHVSLGNGHMLAKGTNFQDRQLIRKKCLSCPICKFILKLIGFKKKNLEILMVNHYLNIVYSFLYCFEPFCCCTVLSSTSHAMELSSLMQDHCRPQGRSHLWGGSAQ